MAESTNGLFLWGDDFEASLDGLEKIEKVGKQCTVIVINVSCKSGNFESKFCITVLKFAMHSMLGSCKQTKSNKGSRKYHAYISLTLDENLL